MDLTKWMRRYVKLIHELERGQGRATTPRLKSSHTATPQEPSANRHNNRSPVAAHLIRRNNGVSNIAW